MLSRRCGPALLLAALLPWAEPVQAACSRAYKVPLALMGGNVLLQPDGRVAGAYPELLRRGGESLGCRFEVEAMPRARVEMLFQKAAADVLMPASRTPQRDAIAEFVPLMLSRATLNYLAREGQSEPPRSLKALVQQTQLRVALVRGYDYGPAYRAMEAALRERGRLVLETDPLGVARALAAGLADVTVLNAYHLHGLSSSDPRMEGLDARLRSEPVEELPWSESGLYLSTRSLKPEERRALRRLFEQAASSGLLWQIMSSHHPPAALEGNLRPR